MPGVRVVTAAMAMRCLRCRRDDGHEPGCAQAVADLRGTVYIDRLVLPSGWQLVARSAEGGIFLHRGAPAMTAIYSCEAHGDSLWHHMSCAVANRDPTWDELRTVKEWLLGDIEAYLVAPPKARYVNQHPHVLHLFAPVDQEHLPLPDFTAGSGSL